MNTHRAKAILNALRTPRARQETVPAPVEATTLDGIEQTLLPDESSHPVLLMVRGPHQGMVFPLGDEQIVGRDDDAGIAIKDDSVSRAHARIVRRSGTVFVEDLESRNGTFVRGARVTRRTKVRDGDYVHFGAVSVAKLRMMDDLEMTAIRALYESTLRDPLTRLYNRRYFDERIRSESSFAQRHRAPLALLLIDIDHFKHVNDEHGHQAGDVVLQLVAATIQRMMRPEDVVARYGGEEFVVIARNTSLRNAEIFADRIRTRIASLEVTWEGHSLMVTASIGVTAFEEGHAYASVDAMLQAADEALYAAKANGRNRVSTLPQLRSTPPAGQQRSTEGRLVPEAIPAKDKLR